MFEASYLAVQSDEKTFQLHTALSHLVLVCRNAAVVCQKRLAAFGTKAVKDNVCILKDNAMYAGLPSSLSIMFLVVVSRCVTT